VVICLLFWFLIIGHRLILYRITDETCGPPSGFYAEYDNYSEVVLVAICPPIVMLVLAYFLIRSVRNVIERQAAIGISTTQTNVVKRSRLNQMDSQVTLMLMLESIILIITFFPYAFELVYENISANWYKSSLRVAIENIFIEIIHATSYTFFVSSFYISIITNGGFRRQIKRVLRMNREYRSTGNTNTLVNINTVTKNDTNGASP
jgi:hypothetical protein